MNNYLVYLLEFPDGKYYVGITNNFERRMFAHKHRFARLLNIEWEDVKKITLDSNLTKEDALQLEVYTSKKYDTIVNGYNLFVGPQGGSNSPNFGIKMSLEARKKMSNSRIGRNGPMTGKTHSQRTKEKIAQANFKRNYKGTKVIDIVNGYVYDTINIASRAYNIKHSTLKAYLSRRLTNKTNLRKLKDV
jgi:predicted GIY-YIG superfamily endonuclease